LFASMIFAEVVWYFLARIQIVSPDSTECSVVSAPSATGTASEPAGNAVAGPAVETANGSASGPGLSTGAAPTGIMS